MGTANKIDATKLTISTLDKTTTDPLARKIRQNIKNKEIMKNVTVVFSTEKAINNAMLGSIVFVPAIAGLLIANYIILDVCEKSLL